MKSILLLLCLYITVAVNAQTFSWINDGYINQSGGGTYPNVDGSGIDLEISGLYDDLALNSVSIFTGIDNGESEGVIHYYSFAFSEPVTVTLSIDNVNNGNCWYDYLLFSGEPIFEVVSIASQSGNTIYPQGTGDGYVKVRYEGVTNFIIQHGNGEGCNPGFLILNPIAFHASPLGITSAKPNGPKVESFPNPASGDVHFNFGQISGELKITSLYGQEVFREKIQTANYNLDASAFAKGFYLYTYSTGTATTTGNLVIE